MTNETKPVLLTEADWERLMHEVLKSGTLATIKAELRERGLIAPGPVDALLIEAREICAAYIERQGEAVSAQVFRNGEYDNGRSVSIALAALKRGMELAKPEVTREMVRDALKDALELTDTPIEHGDFGFSETHNYRGNIERVVTRLHAALTKGQSK